MKIKKETIEKGKKFLKLLGAILFFLVALWITINYFVDEFTKEKLYDKDLQIEEDILFKELENTY
jgi:hypothetical protein